MKVKKKICASDVQVSESSDGNGNGYGHGGADCSVGGIVKGGKVTCTIRDKNSDGPVYDTYTIIDGGKGDCDGKKNGAIGIDYKLPDYCQPKDLCVEIRDWGKDNKSGTWDDVITTRPVEKDDKDCYEKPEAEIDLCKEVVCILDKNGKKDSDQIIDSVGDKIVYKFTVTNNGNVDLSDLKLFDKVECNDAQQVWESCKLEAGCSITFYYVYTVTKADLDKARDIETVTTKKGFFTCVEKYCTGDLEIDNFAYVSATANIRDDKGDYTKTYVNDYDEASASVTCPNGCKNTYCEDEPYNTADYGHTLEQLCEQFQQAAA